MAAVNGSITFVRAVQGNTEGTVKFSKTAHLLNRAADRLHEAHAFSGIPYIEIFLLSHFRLYYTPPLYSHLSHTTLFH